ncbi:MAG: hypothetical protein ACRDKS_02830 [Actinomycetota bacterium]
MRRTIIAAITVPFALASAGAADSLISQRTTAAESAVQRPAAVEARDAKTAAVEGPLLIVRGTPDGAVVGEPTARYRGRVAKGVTLTVNGEAVEIERLGFWHVEVPLTEGANTFTFTATGPDGATETVDRDVTFDPSLATLRPAKPADGDRVRVEQERAITRPSV